MLVDPVRLGAFCRWPRSEPDCQTCRAPSPPYQPSRKARTRKPEEVVETNNGNGWPVSTLAAPAYPMIAFAAPRWRISQCGSPGSEFSDTARRRVLARGVARLAADPESLPLLLHPAARGGYPERAQAQKRSPAGSARRTAAVLGHGRQDAPAAPPAQARREVSQVKSRAVRQKLEDDRRGSGVRAGTGEIALGCARPYFRWSRPPKRRRPVRRIPMTETISPAEAPPAAESPPAPLPSSLRARTPTPLPSGPSTRPPGTCTTGP